jgi:hypothetical protein
MLWAKYGACFALSSRVIVSFVTVREFVMLDLYFDSVKCMLVSVKLLCVCVKFLKILSVSKKRGIFVIMEKLGLFLQNVI